MAGADEGGTGVRSDTRTVVALTAVVVVLALVVVAAAVGGSWDLEDRHFGEVAEPESTRPPQPPAPTPGQDPADEPAAADLSWLGVVMRILLTLALVVAALFALWWLWRRLRERPVPVRRPPGGSGVAAVEAEPELPVLQRGVTEAQRFLDEVPSATDAVIAAWLALEEAAASSGVRRAPAQTPTEFTLAVLERTAAEPAETRELLALYHRARFSTQPVGSDDVARASACLARLAANWAAVRDRSEAGP